MQTERRKAFQTNQQSSVYSINHSGISKVSLREKQQTSDLITQKPSNTSGIFFPSLSPTIQSAAVNIFLCFIEKVEVKVEEKLRRMQNRTSVFRHDLVFPQLVQITNKQ